MTGASAGSIALTALGGAINRVDPGATAFVHRRSRMLAQYIASWRPGTSGKPAQAWLKTAHGAMARYASGAAYQNYADPTLTNWRKAYYGDSAPRLKKLKQQYDPKRFFDFPQALYPFPQPRPPTRLARRSFLARPALEDELGVAGDLRSPRAFRTAGHFGRGGVGKGNACTPDGRASSPEQPPRHALGWTSAQETVALGVCVLENRCRHGGSRSPPGPLRARRPRGHPRPPRRGPSHRRLRRRHRRRRRSRLVAAPARPEDGYAARSRSSGVDFGSDADAGRATSA